MSTSPTDSTNLMGYLAGDPALTTLPTGTAVAELRVGVNQARNSREDAGFFDVPVYGKAGKAAARTSKRAATSRSTASCSATDTARFALSSS